MSQEQSFGVLYGQKTTSDTDELLIYSSYEDAKASPKKGDFIVITRRDESGDKFLARVEAEIYDEDPIFRSQDKTLVAVHYARMAERELSERDKQKIFSYTYRVRMLGTFTQKGTRISFTTAVRKLPFVSYFARHLKPQEVEAIINADDATGIPLGKLCIGDDERDEQVIKFEIGRLRSKRTMVFAQSGFGKTNLIKVMLYHALSDTSYGKLIFDLNGEYVLDSDKTRGLGSVEDPKVKENLVLFSDKPMPKGRFIDAGKVKINMHKHLSVSDLLNFSAGFSEVMKSFLIYLDEEQLEDFIPKIGDYVKDPAKLHKDFPDFWKEKDAGASKTIAGIRKRISHLIDEKGGLHSSTSTMLEDVFDYLRKGKTVVIDLSLKDSMDASIISTIFVRKLFERNKASFTVSEQLDLFGNNGPIETVIFVEEAQNVLSDEMVRTNANPFVRCAKEGRKFGLGMVTITQRPSAISEEIRTQAENFFALHMGNSDDIRALVKSNIHYEGVIASFIQRETIPGNLYMVTSGRAFVVPIRVYEFEHIAKEHFYPR